MNCGPLWLAALLAGLSSAGHCLSMCGPLAPALMSPGSAHGWAQGVGLNLGRLMGYVAWGAAIGWSAQMLWGIGPLLWIAQFVRALVVGALLLLAVRVWRNRDDQISRWIGLKIWSVARRLLEPLRALPAPFSWLSTGMVWALLPCGMVYSMLLLALATGSSAQGAWALLWFGLGTLPAMLLTSVASAGLARHWSRLLAQPRMRQLAAVAIVLLALWNLALLGHWMPETM